jgi:UDP-N-acetyl-D-mannosaminuronic acid dehydrogenase
MLENKRVCVIGLGYIGLPTAALLASKGFQVLGVDILPSVVETINLGNIHIIEPELDKYVKNGVNDGFLKASLTPDFSDVFIIAVPTPFHAGFIPNIDYVISAAKSIAPYVKKGNLVILESTSPVGTTEKLAKTLEDNGVNINEIFVAHCPERVLPGQVMRELVENDRIVGGIDEKSSSEVKSFYQQFVNGNVITTGSKTAEMCKLVENSSRDVNIAFANELSMICDEAEIDVRELITLANKHPRVNILQPGCGVGGHCIAVDPWFIVSDFPKYSNIIKQARLTNVYKTEWVVDKIIGSVNEFVVKYNFSPKVACLGLAFKPNIDDLREAPAIEIFKKLRESTINVFAVEPNIGFNQELKTISLEKSLSECDIIVVLVAHKEFLHLNAEGLPGKIFFNFAF